MKLPFSINVGQNRKRPNLVGNRGVLGSGHSMQNSILLVVDSSTFELSLKVALEKNRVGVLHHRGNSQKKKEDKDP